MAKKEIKGYIKLQIDAGKANPAPPVWPALGQYWVPIQEFTQKFNDQTKDQMGMKLPVVITVYEDRSFEFVVKTPPAAFLLKKELNIPKASGVPHKEKVAHASIDILKNIAETKMADLNANDVAAGIKVIQWTARASGITTDVDGKTTDEIREMLK